MRTPPPTHTVETAAPPTPTCTVSMMQSAAASRSLLLSAFSSCVVTHALERPRFSSTRNALQATQNMRITHKPSQSLWHNTTGGKLLQRLQPPPPTHVLQQLC